MRVLCINKSIPSSKSPPPFVVLVIIITTLGIYMYDLQLSFLWVIYKRLTRSEES